jgi:hypothetical protein
MSLHEMERIMSLTLLLVVFAAAVNAGLLAIERRLSPLRGLAVYLSDAR